MKTTIINMFVFLLILLSVSAKPQVLDQSQLIYNAGTSARNLPGYSTFQSFTAGMTGTLVEIDMGVFNYINGAGTLKIYSGPDTTGALLQSIPVTVNCPSGNCFAQFNTSVSITSGQVYTFRLIPGAGIPDPYGVQVEVPGTYPGGQMGLVDPSGISYPGFDQVFKTFVEGEHVGVGVIKTSYPSLACYQQGSLLYITIPAEINTSGNIALYDIFGKALTSIPFQKNTGHVEIDVSRFPTGICLLSLSKASNVLSKKVILSRK